MSLSIEPALDAENILQAAAQLEQIEKQSSELCKRCGETEYIKFKENYVISHRNTDLSGKFRLTENNAGCGFEFIWDDAQYGSETLNVIDFLKRCGGYMTGASRRDRQSAFKVHEDDLGKFQKFLTCFYDIYKKADVEAFVDALLDDS